MDSFDFSEDFISYLRIQYSYHFQSHIKRMEIDEARQYFGYLLRTPDAFDRSRRLENLNAYIHVYEVMYGYDE